MPIPQIDVKISEPVRATLAALGRTEDIRFSPDNKLLAIAGFGRNRCLILRIDVRPGLAGPEVEIHDFMELTSSSIGAVHGLDFIDDKTLVIANRDGLLSILPLPDGELGGRRCKVDAVRHLRGGLFGLLQTPGSVIARHEPNGRVSLFVCNNYTHRVTRHVIDARSPYRVRSNRIVARRRISIPDGVALSYDGGWLAVSSHSTHDIKLFASSQMGRRTQPSGSLSGLLYPHGLRFTEDDAHLLVADSGAPVIKIYDRGSGWDGSREPARSVVVLDDETFRRGNHNPTEGGPKGIDIDRTNTVLAMTCEEQILTFFSLDAILGDDRAGQFGQAA